MPPIRIHEPAVLFQIHNTYKGGRGDKDIYEATRGHWRMNPDRHPAMKYAFGVDRGLVVEVFRIDEWHVSGERTGRWMFTGRRDAPMTRKYAGEDVSDYFRSRNPVTFVNC